MAGFCWFLCFMATVAVVLIVGVIVPVQYFSVDTQYSVGIDSVVSGLDPAPMGVSFNLTLAVTSRSHGAKACVNPSMYAEIFYRGVQIACSDAETRRFCARPRKTAEMNVVARATGVPVGHVLDGLATEMRQGAAVFDLKLHVPAKSYGGLALAPWLREVTASVRLKETPIGAGSRPETTESIPTEYCVSTLKYWTGTITPTISTTATVAMKHRNQQKPAILALLSSSRPIPVVSPWGACLSTSTSIPAGCLSVR